MKKLLYLIILFAIAVFKVGAQQCLTTKGCTLYTIEYPSSGAPYTATTSWHVLKNPAKGTDALMNGGNYTRFNVVSGNTYEWTYCEDYDGVSTSWDAQLTLLKSDLSTQLCFSTDAGGNCGLAPYISWTANFTGVVCLLTTAYIKGVGGCQFNSTTYNKLAYRMIAGVTCTTPGTPATATGTPTGQTSANLSWSAGSPAGSSTVTYYWVVGKSSSVTYGGSSAIAQGTTTGTSATTSALSCGTTYYLRVYAKTSCDGTSSGYKTSSSFTTTSCVVCTTPGTPATAIGTPTGQTTANLSWTAGSPIGSSTVTYYWVIGTSTSVSYGGSGVIDQGSTTGTSATTSKLSCGNTYYLRVFAKTSCDGTSSGIKTSAAFTTSACTNGQILGIDVSRYQGTINWVQVKNQDFKKFAFIKATQGYTSDANDTYFLKNAPLALAAGMIIGAYHVAMPKNYSALDEANHFVDVAGSFIGNGFLPPALDLEPDYVESLGKTNLSVWVQAWINQVKARTSVSPIIYATHYDATNLLNSSLNAYNLWIANYESDPNTTPTNLGIWSTWTFNQYSEKGSISGITENFVDLDIFNGDATAFNNLIGATPVTLACNNDNACSPKILPINSTCVPISCSTVGATTEPIPFNGGSSCTSTYQAGRYDDDVWFTLTPTNTKTIKIAVTPTSNTSNFDVAVGVYSGSCSSPIQMTCADVNSVGATEQLSITPTAGATYLVRVFSYGIGSTYSGDFDICACNNCTSGIDEIENERIKVYPNPTTGKFDISEIETLGNKFKVDVIDFLGKIIYSSVYTDFGNKISLDLSAYPNGLYLIRLSNNEASYQKKVIKK